MEPATKQAIDELNGVMQRHFAFGAARGTMVAGRLGILLYYRSPPAGTPDRVDDAVREQIDASHLAASIIKAGDATTQFGHTPDADVTCLQFLAQPEQLQAINRALVFAAIRNEGAKRAKSEVRDGIGT